MRQEGKLSQIIFFLHVIRRLLIPTTSNRCLAKVDLSKRKNKLQKASSPKPYPPHLFSKWCYLSTENIQIALLCTFRNHCPQQGPQLLRRTLLLSYNSSFCCCCCCQDGLSTDRRWNNRAMLPSDLMLHTSRLIYGTQHVGGGDVRCVPRTVSMIQREDRAKESTLLWVGAGICLAAKRGLMVNEWRKKKEKKKRKELLREQHRYLYSWNSSALLATPATATATAAGVAPITITITTTTITTTTVTTAATA